MNKNNSWDCKICKKSFENYKKLSIHLRVHKITTKKYYDTYYIENGEGICKSCGNITNYYSLNKGYASFCSIGCINKCKETREKIEKTCKKKYNFTCAFQNEKVKQKIKDSCNKNYGVDCSLSSCKVREKGKNKIIEKYGVDNVFQSEIIKNKIKETNLKKYGVEFATKNEKVKQKTKDTNIIKYGVPYLLQNEYFAKLSHDNVFKKYGVDNVFQSEIIKNKIKETNLKKYGVEFPMQNEEIRNKTFLNEKHSYKLRKYKLKDGRDVLYQSKLELRFIKECENKNIYIENGDAIDYFYENKNKKYFIDFKILENDKWRLVEIKGKTRWFNSDLESGVMKAKINAAVEFSKKNEFLEYEIILNNKLWDYKNFLSINI